MKMHSGRPIIRSTKDHVLVLCPLGHVVYGMPADQWGGSLIEAKAGDPAWRIECDGAIAEEAGL